MGEPKNCFFAPVPDDCHVAVCNPGTGACEPVVGHEGAPCERGGDPCMTGKACVSGVCQGGAPKDCAGVADACNTAVCDAATGGCKKTPKPAGGACDGAVDECNAGVCDQAGVCQKVPKPGAKCMSAADDCNAGVCDAAGVCGAVPVNEGGSCEDGNACTLGEACSSGQCIGGKSEGYVEYLRETFGGSPAGWTTEGEWQIGPAKASPGNASLGHEDPVADHTDTNDGGLAGVVIGGYPATVTHGPKYLVSPPVDASGAESVWLSFHRFLNSDYAPYMTNTIDVFDGSAWVNVWSSDDGASIQDAAWTLVTHDLSKYKNAELRVRFGFEVGGNGAFRVAGWSIDDLAISNKICDGGR